jgi:hypothetical protein
VAEEERDDVAAELARARDEARAAAPPRDAPSRTGSPASTRAPDGATGASAPVGAAAPPSPDGTAAPSATAVNELWRADPAGGRSGLAAALERLLSPRLSAQRDWNAAQVRLDNELLRWVEDRFAATHAHYDALLGALGHRLDEADERHRRLEEELVVHVRELVRRVDIATAEASRGRAALELELEDLRARLARLERALEGRA